MTDHKKLEQTESTRHYRLLRGRHYMTGADGTQKRYSPNIPGENVLELTAAQAAKLGSRLELLPLGVTAIGPASDLPRGTSPGSGVPATPTVDPVSQAAIAEAKGDRVGSSRGEEDSKNGGLKDKEGKGQGQGQGQGQEDKKPTVPTTGGMGTSNLTGTAKK